MKFLAIFFALFSISSGVCADAAQVIKSNFEGDNKLGYFMFDASNIQAGVEYNSSTLGRSIRYTVDIRGECGGVQIYQESGSERVVIDGSCNGQGAQIHQYIYQWSPSNKNWCLREDITGQKADRTSGSDEETEVTKVKGCVLFGKAPD